MLNQSEMNELVVFELANEKGKFAIGVEYPIPEIQWALERGFDEDWWRLIDVCVVTHSQGQMVRVFRLTDAGRVRFAELNKKQGKEAGRET